jgi:hypothetical protein
MMITILCILAALVAGWYLLHRQGAPQFWGFVRAHGDLAYDWFTSEPCWLIYDPATSAPPARSALTAYTIGFKVYVPKLGRMVTVYCLRDEIDTSQQRFIAAVLERRDIADTKTQQVLHLSRLLAADRLDAPKHLWHDLPLLPDGKAYVEARQAALPELLDICEADAECRAVINRYAVQRQAMIALYRQLNTTVPGWIGAMYVPVLTLVYPRPLSHALQVLAESRPDDLHAELFQLFEHTPWFKSVS